MTVGEAEASKCKTLSKLLCLLLVPQVGWLVFPPCNHRHFVIAAGKFWWDCLAQTGWDYLQAKGGYSRGGHLSLFFLLWNSAVLGSYFGLMDTRVY